MCAREWSTSCSVVARRMRTRPGSMPMTPSRADAESPLEAADVELLATSAALVGERDAHHSLLERLHKLRLDAGETELAAKAAVLLGLNLAIAGEWGRRWGGSGEPSVSWARLGRIRSFRAICCCGRRPALVVR